MHSEGVKDSAWNSERFGMCSMDVDGFLWSLQNLMDFEECQWILIDSQ